MNNHVFLYMWLFIFYDSHRYLLLYDNNNFKLTI